MTKLILEAKAIRKSYSIANKKYLIFQDLNFSLKKSEIIALIGPSGSGKTSLLNILGLLDNEFSGELKIAETTCKNLKDEAKNKIRMHNLGFVFQFHHLLPDFTALENIMIPQMLIKTKQQYEIKARAKDLLSRVGLKDRMYSYPSQLSGGEQQRVAIVRALVNYPKILIADEPTGNLDVKNASSFFKLILELVTQEGLACIVASHDLNLIKNIPIRYQIAKHNLIRVENV